MTGSLEERVVDHIRERGPLTGSELREAFSEDSLILWQTCKRARALSVTRVGTRYLRLDRRVDGFARLSPSILREFLSYSVVGLAEDGDGMPRRVREVAHHIEAVSKSKRELAGAIVSNIMQQQGDMGGDGLQFCFILAGDIAYNMANDAPRPEQSTGEFVRGSDIDLVAVLEDSASDDLIRGLDRAIYGEKYRTLISPTAREEIDYVIKRLSRVREQLRFDTFKHMVACKILEEGLLLYGSESLFMQIKRMLGDQGITQKLGDLEERARAFRTTAEEYLLHTDPDKARRDSLYLFYPAEESEEFE